MQAWFNDMCDKLRDEDKDQLARARSDLMRYENMDRVNLFCMDRTTSPVPIVDAIEWVKKHKPRLQLGDGWYIAARQGYTWFMPQEVVDVSLYKPQKSVCSIM